MQQHPERGRVHPGLSAHKEAREGGPQMRMHSFGRLVLPPMTWDAHMSFVHSLAWWAQSCSPVPPLRSIKPNSHQLFANFRSPTDMEPCVCLTHLGDEHVCHTWISRGNHLQTIRPAGPVRCPRSQSGAAQPHASPGEWQTRDIPILGTGVRQILMNHPQRVVRPWAVQQ